MPIHQKKIRKVFNLSWRVALVGCLFIIPFVPPFREMLMPGIVSFVKTYHDVFLNLLYFVFSICSLLLIILVVLLQREYRRNQTDDTPYKSQLVVKKYYEEAKSYDFTKAIATAISKYSRRDLGPAADNIEEVTADGTYQTFYSNGHLEKEFTYKNGKFNGQWLAYYSDGVLHQEKQYKDGKLHGVFRAYDELGVLYFAIEYKDGKKHGIEKNYFRDGSVQYLDTYVEGKMVNRKTFNEAGILQFDYNYHDGK